MTTNVKFGDIFASKSGLKYVAVSSDKTSVWLFNEMRDLVIAQQTEAGWQTNYVRNGSSGKVIYSNMDKSAEPAGALTDAYKIRGPWLEQDHSDAIVIFVGEAFDKQTGYIQRYAALPTFEGFELVTPDEFKQKIGLFERYDEIYLDFPVNSSLQELRVTTSFDRLRVTPSDDVNFRGAEETPQKEKTPADNQISINSPQVVAPIHTETPAVLVNPAIITQEAPERMVPRDLTVTEAEGDSEEDRPITSIGNVGAIRRRDL